MKDNITIENCKPQHKRLIWKDCICGGKTQHTHECSKNHRKNYIHNFSTVINKEIRKKRVEKHLCACCGKKVESKKCPHCKKIIGYNYRCKECYSKIEKYNKLYTERKNGNKTN